MQTYAPVPVNIDRNWRMLIGGNLIEAEWDERLDVVNPATGQVVTKNAYVRFDSPGPSA